MTTPRRNPDKLDGGTQPGLNQPLNQKVGPDREVQTGNPGSYDAAEARQGPSRQENDELGLRVSPLGSGPTLGTDQDQQTQAPKREHDENLGRDIGRGRKAQEFTERNQTQNLNLDNREG